MILPKVHAMNPELHPEPDHFMDHLRPCMTDEFIQVLTRFHQKPLGIFSKSLQNTLQDLGKIL
jgi:hypothetical protein